MKTTYRIGAALLLIVLLASACTPSANPPNSKSMLVISSMISSLGGEGTNNEVGVYSYTVILTNNSDLPINVKSVLPAIQNKFTSRLLGSNPEVSVEKAVPNGESIEINGELRFDFKNLTKQQISDMGEPVAGFSIISQSYLSLPPTQ